MVAHTRENSATLRLKDWGETFATISGHTMKCVEAILESYVDRTDKIAVAAIAKLRMILVWRRLLSDRG